jgi:large subunit ribosomal protein L18
MEDKKIRVQRRKAKVRGRIPKEGFRLSVDRSNRYLFAQIIDQKTGKTVLGLTDKKALEKADGKTKVEKAKDFGEKFALETAKLKIKRVYFDRGPFRYHGRVKAFAEGVKQGGVEF